MYILNHRTAAWYQAVLDDLDGPTYRLITLLPDALQRKGGKLVLGSYQLIFRVDPPWIQVWIHLGNGAIMGGLGHVGATVTPSTMARLHDWWGCPVAVPPQPVWCSVAYVDGTRIGSVVEAPWPSCVAAVVQGVIDARRPHGLARDASQ